MPDPLLSRQELADFLGVPPGTVARWASEGSGPPYFRLGRHTRYRLADVERWLSERRADGREQPRGRRPLRAVGER